MTLTKALEALGIEKGSIVDVVLALRAMLPPATDYVEAADKINVNGFEMLKGNPWAAFTDESAWSVIGSIASVGMNWDSDIVMFTDGTKHVARNVKLSASDQFKFRKDKDWGTNFGAEGSTEPFVMELDKEYPASAGGKNLAVPADGAYDLVLDPEAKVFYITEAFQTYPGYDSESAWSVIGAIGSFEMNWDKDIAMITDGTWHVAEGVALTTGDQFKFRKDQDWGTNLGAEGNTEPFIVTLDKEYPASAGGKNLAVPADGTYDLLVNPDGKLFKVVESLGGKSGLIGGGDEPQEEKPGAWSLIGTIGGTSWDTDTDLDNIEGDIWVVRSVAINATDEFKIRADHDWGTSWGGPEANSKSTIDPSNPYDVYKPTLGKAFASGDKNIQVGADGFYDITLDYAAQTILIEEHKAVYSLIGEIAGSSWNKDFVMSESNGIWSSPVLNITGGFKIRYDYSWADDHTYGAESGSFVPTIGTPFTATQPGSDIKLAEAGEYKVIFDPATKEITITTVAFPEHLYMIGDEFGGWAWGSDGVVELSPVLHNPEWGAEAEGQFYTIKYFSAGKGFKFNSNRDWDGKEFNGLATNDGFTQSGGNCVVDADGFYLVHIDLKNEKLHVEPARVYGLGECWGTWDPVDDNLFKADGKTLKLKAASAGHLRMFVESSIATSGWWTREFNIIDGKIVYRVMDELAAPSVLANQEIVLDFNAGTGAIQGEGDAPVLPTAMYIIGDGVVGGGWDWNTNASEMIPVNGAPGQFWAIRNLAADTGFKFNSVKDWNGSEFNSLGGNDSGFTTKDGNCVVAESGVYMIYVDAANGKIGVEKANVYGIGECWGGWDKKNESAKFAESEGKLSVTVPAAGKLRMYAETSTGTTDWWTREFNVIEGKIVYRADGGELAEVKAEAGKKYTLDFNAGTATIE